MLNWLKEKLNAIVGWFGDLFVGVFKALWDLVKDFFCWILESLLDLVNWAVNSINIGGIDDYQGSWSSLPAEIINVMQLLGIGTAVSIILAAVLIRLVLQLIPLTRLGS